MRTRIVLVIILLAVGLCFVPVMGYGEDNELEKFRELMFAEIKASGMDFYLLDAKIRYIMHNPTTFLSVWLVYDHHGRFFEQTPMRYSYHFLKGLGTKGKVIATVTDNRAAFFHRSKMVLLELFKEHLMALWVHISAMFPDMENDIIAGFYSEEKILLGYFYQGEYHLWEK